MQTALYVIWILIPLVYFLIAIWTQLEQLSKKDTKKKPREASELFRQGFFVTMCVALAFFVDIFMRDKLIVPLLPSFIPVSLFRVLLLPLILYLAALLVGGSKPIRIDKSNKGPKKKRR